MPRPVERRFIASQDRVVRLDMARVLPRIGLALDAGRMLYGGLNAGGVEQGWLDFIGSQASLVKKCGKGVLVHYFSLLAGSLEGEHGWLGYLVGEAVWLKELLG